MNLMGVCVRRFFLGVSLGLLSMIVSCGGSGAGTEGASNMPSTGTVVLKPPKLSFTDTGVSVSDGVTRNGLWAVESDVSWEYSLDQGVTWTLGSGGSFEVKGD
jgi:hypothetical protein